MRTKDIGVFCRCAEVGKMKNRLCIITLLATLKAGTAFAATGSGGGGISLAGWIFIGFLGVVITFQFIPCLFMFGSMMASIFGKARGNKKVAENGKTNHS